MLILILFHDTGYRYLKHSYQEKVCKHMRHFFPKVQKYVIENNEGCYFNTLKTAL